ncbi:error-prone DNA polymerase [Wenzhouxiangella marina]|uniref:Error-prone DNA polymerase n=1 Tax=Wenzhouxiangella marina TaxID=1579979 RepID=A0A0K0XV76_9GAMM|nr:error-prone DNA polymerase [Wenzhouxiangella marina]AKS41614.1 DNA polymerase [Wenzhouxiangella marina]MBB6086627.1 error-prone DNA polymerase [Wenzhouxiangella marina]
MVAYAELHALSAFSFRRAVALPGELVQRAHALGYRALALTDECSMAGIVRAHEAARELGLPLIVGSELQVELSVGEPQRLVLLAPDQTAYSEICRLITTARRRASKGRYRLLMEDLDGALDRVLVIWKPALESPAEEADRERRLDHWLAPAQWLKARFEGRLWLGASRLLRPGEATAFQALEKLGRLLDLPRLACGDVRMAERAQRPLADVLSALELQRPLSECGLDLAANGERHLRPLETLDKLYPAHWLEETLRLAERCRFSMDQLNYRYPSELVPGPLTPARHLRRLTLEGMTQRYGEHPPDRVRALVAKELSLIEDMGVEAFFLTVHDLVRFARSRGILCQGRGSAANSAVCYCLGVTEVDPARQQLLFERFLSKERDEPPDIDVDFEHERREEVLQYVYEKYGRDRAALAATVISYRPKSALKDVGRALGLDPVRMNRLTASLAWWDQPEVWPERLAECGFDPDAPVTRQLMTLSGQLVGRPRHLSQHVGGMVISDAPLHHLVPVENAAMDERTIIQWDKDDLETLGLLKVDCLALGMLTVIRKAIDLINARNRPEPALSLARLPREDSATYDMLCKGDALGVFQVESRAQMAMLPRLKPRCFYDLVIEVAIVRPGPIQGDMVHPYLERRTDPDRVRYPSPELETVLKRTLGVPIFQEQVMQIAIVAAGFTPGEADQLRRAMAAWKRRGGLEPFRDKLIEGMHRRGYPTDFAERIYRQIQGFGDYGFPESHAASFALLTYFSAWLKCHHPAPFACALLNSQPMGFYAPAQIINDVRRHGVRVLPADVRFSGWDCSLEAETSIRLGLGMIKGMNADAVERLVAAREQRPFYSVQDLAERARLDRRQLKALAEGNALKGLAGHRNRARWQALASAVQGDLLAGASIAEERVSIRPPDRQSSLLDDYASTGLSLEQHPAGLIRPRIGRRLRRARELAGLNDGTPIEVLGLVTHRQRPGTASGVIFLSLEDETGIINVVVWPKLLERYRREILDARLLRVAGTLQNAQGTQHVIARRFHAEDERLATLAAGSRDFH